ncbi:MAG: glutathione peroxidase [Pseudomonadota bacterium]
MTGQYAGLRTLQEQKQEEGFSVLGFPCNQFGAQEPGSDAEILDFAKSKYDVNFPMFSKVEVNGDNACDLYNILRSAQPNEDGSTDITWNFTKFLVDKTGTVIKRFDPKTTPEEIQAQIPGLLA